MLHIEKADFGYKNTLVHVPNLHLESGKLYALIGRNGIGKSTFLQTLIGLIPLVSGEILVQDNPLSKLRKKELAKKVAFVCTSFPISDTLSVWEYLILGRIPYTNLFGTSKEHDEKIVLEIIALLQLTSLADKFTTQLSDGEKQLVAIGQALVQETGLLLLDEPTAFLDYENKWKIVEILKKCTNDNQLCTVFSSHDLEIALDFADDLLLINPITKELRKVPTDSITKKEILAFCFPSL